MIPTMHQTHDKRKIILDIGIKLGSVRVQKDTKFNINSVTNHNNVDSN